MARRSDRWLGDAQYSSDLIHNWPSDCVGKLRVTAGIPDTIVLGNSGRLPGWLRKVVSITSVIDLSALAAVNILHYRITRAENELTIAVISPGAFRSLLSSRVSKYTQVRATNSVQTQTQHGNTYKKPLTQHSLIKQ